MNQRVRQIYEHLHTIPEKSGSEIKTSEFLAEALRKSGYEVSTHVGGYGVVGVLRGKDAGPVVGIRSDMDALIHNVGGKETFVHSCGHDANCAMTLAMAESVAAKGIKRGALKILFQPAEETLSGALAMIKAGAADDIEYLFGLHLRPEQEAKLGYATPSLVHNGAILTKAYVEGQVAHGARPHLGINAIDAAMLVVNAINAIHEDPGTSWSIKTTKFVSNGLVTNAIPDRVDLAFDVRAEKNSIIESLLSKIKEILEYAPKAAGGKGVLVEAGVVPAPSYDAGLTDMLAESIKETMGESALLPPLFTPGGDDFHFFTKERPSIKTAFLGLGADLTPGLHNPAMQFNKDVLENGAKVLENAVRKLLG